MIAKLHYTPMQLAVTEGQAGSQEEKRKGYLRKLLREECKLQRQQKAHIEVPITQEFTIKCNLFDKKATKRKLTGRGGGGGGWGINVTSSLFLGQSPV